MHEMRLVWSEYVNKNRKISKVKWLQWIKK